MPRTSGVNGRSIMGSLKIAVVFGAANFLAQLVVYIIGFALGPANTTRNVLGISLYDVASVITFPFVYLAEQYQWKTLGMAVFLLNSMVWAGVAFIIFWVKEAFKRRLRD
ncbi:MAG: hypothetical protein WBX11_13040 [Thiobacillaceae bacterium]|jgi:hypothetical protein